MAKGLLRVSLLVAGFIVCLWPSPARANLIVNGDFEVPNLVGTGFAIYPGVGPVTGWASSVGGGIEIQYGNVAGLAHSLDQLVELDSTSNSNMFQDVATTPGQGYTLSFWYSPRPGQPASTNPVEVYWDGVLLDTRTGVGGPNTVWTQFSYTVYGSVGPDTRLLFLAVGTSDSLGGYLDDVALEAAVPEPGTLLLVGSGLAVLARRRSRRG